MEPIEHGQGWQAVGRVVAEAGWVLTLRLFAHLVQVVDKVATRAVGTEADRVVGATQVCLVLGVTGNGSQLLLSMGKLALVSVLARAILLEGAAQLGLVPVGVGLGWLLLLLLLVLLVVVAVQLFGQVVQLEEGVGRLFRDGVGRVG